MATAACADGEQDWHQCTEEEPHAIDDEQFQAEETPMDPSEASKIQANGSIKTHSGAGAEHQGSSPDLKKPPFEPKGLPEIHARLSLPDELWMTVLECPCTFPPEIFSTVMLNLIKNPNITSSHLFRADIFYDSDRDHLFCPDDESNPYRGLAKHLKAEYQPRRALWPGFALERTVVRQLVPRNPQLDKHLVQTCHFFRKQTEDAEQALVLYMPHVEGPEDMPFYHPAVAQLAFLHEWRELRTTTTQQQQGTLTLLYRLFPNGTLSRKLERTALKLLQTIHKHGQGQLLGYEKRVHHDRIIPQKRYQDTYTRLKATYGRQLSEQWVEVTDPGKHVFEDIGIAAFLIELWADMYAPPPTTSQPNQPGPPKPPFPGFIDIGCGNGLLVHILASEGYPGHGFDARARKTWSIFPPAIQARLQQRILVPRALCRSGEHPPLWHDGTVAPGTFLISNHADELTAWTPLLASGNASSFIAIPCCSHDLSGARFRASPPSSQRDDRPPRQTPHGQAAETGSLARPAPGAANRKPPSAYSSLCAYVRRLAEDVHFSPETEVLRIPSTRNTCIVGRYTGGGGERGGGEETDEDKMHRIRGIVERELKRDVDGVAEEWIARAEKLTRKPGSGH